MPAVELEINVFFKIKCYINNKYKGLDLNYKYCFPDINAESYITLSYDTVII